jgi:plasmid maintenance system killer protein
MDVEFADDDLRKLYTDPKYNAGYSTEIIRSFRQKVAFLVSAPDERTVRAGRASTTSS